ncbi:GntR family transcriptional regulator [Candidatus Epulonipiscium viviparus]|uniref:GntR family transcriptional regulator n=1 Tax=Candidatus Epulonipiscium viviparus TaxID=420336 RepID=UPI00016BFDA8|nr:GntR family transcriptional regulator [Candidatus Epulopiscium viviparus]
MDKQTKTIDKLAPIPMFYQLKQILLSDIESNFYPVGTMIPTELELSNMYNISRTTVRQAVLDLVREGYLTRQKGKGTIVAKQKLHHVFVQQIESFNSEMQRLGKIPTTEILGFKKIKATSYIAQVLNLANGADILYMHRRRMVDGEPIVTIITYLPFERCSFLIKYKMEKESLYDLLSLNLDTRIVQVTRRIEVTEANEQDMKLLDIKKGKPIQLFYTVGKNKEGVPIEYSIARYRGDRSSFNVTIRME